MDKDNNNDLLFLGIFILFVGIALFSYSVVSFKDVKKLESQINLEELEDPRMSTATKYDKRLNIADFLNKNLEKHKNLPVKNTVCIYMDYAQNNIISVYNLTYNATNAETYQKSETLRYLKDLSTLYSNYKTCKQYMEYNKELDNLISKAEKSSEDEYYKESKMENFLYGKNQNIERATGGSMRDAVRFPQDDDSINKAERVQQYKNENYSTQQVNGEQNATLYSQTTQYPEGLRQ